QRGVGEDEIAAFCGAMHDEFPRIPWAGADEQRVEGRCRGDLEDEGRLAAAGTDRTADLAGACRRRRRIGASGGQQQDGHKRQYRLLHGWVLRVALSIRPRRTASTMSPESSLPFRLPAASSRASITGSSAGPPSRAA